MKFRFWDSFNECFEFSADFKTAHDVRSSDFWEHYLSAEKSGNDPKLDIQIDGADYFTNDILTIDGEMGNAIPGFFGIVTYCKSGIMVVDHSKKLAFPLSQYFFNWRLIGNAHQLTSIQKPVIN